jgi:hypothetical protein
MIPKTILSVTLAGNGFPWRMIYNVARLDAGFVFLAPLSICSTFSDFRVLGF